METNGHSIPEEIRDIEYLYTSRFWMYVHMETAGLLSLLTFLGH